MSRILPDSVICLERHQKQARRRLSGCRKNCFIFPRSSLGDETPAKCITRVSLNDRAHKNPFLSSGWAATKLTLFSMTASPALFVTETCKFCKSSATHNLGQKHGSCGYDSGFCQYSENRCLSIASNATIAALRFSGCR